MSYGMVRVIAVGRAVGKDVQQAYTNVIKSGISQRIYWPNDQI